MSDRHHVPVSHKRTPPGISSTMANSAMMSSRPSPFMSTSVDVEGATELAELGALFEKITTVLGADPDLEAAQLASRHHIGDAVAVEVADADADIGAGSVIVEVDRTVRRHQAVVGPLVSDQTGPRVCSHLRSSGTA